MGSAKRKLALGAGLAAILVALPACGSSSSNDSSNAPAASEPSTSTTSASASEWADGFCSDAKTWKKSLQQAATTFKNKGNLSASSATAALTQAKNATLEFRGQLERLGTPPTPQGTQAQEAVQSYQGQLQVDYQTLNGEYQQSASGKSQVVKKAQSIELTLRAMVMTLQRAYNSLTKASAGDSELGTALKSNSACQAAFPNT
jgi:hypothetical protein